MSIAVTILNLPSAQFPVQPEYHTKKAAQDNNNRLLKGVKEFVKPNQSTHPTTVVFVKCCFINTISVILFILTSMPLS